VINPNDYNYTKRCPKCGSSTIRYGVQRAQGELFADLFMSSKVISFLCAECGYIVDQFAVKPSRMNLVKQDNE
jgi:predicted nucleic-acid-binding Zn-ribbon protein